jgi:hypothetical protein
VSRDRQLDVLEAALASQVGTAHVRRVSIWSGHPLMVSWFHIDDFYQAPRQANEAPITSIEVDGRLSAVSVRSGRKDVFINAVVFGLTQSSQLGGRYPGE